MIKHTQNDQTADKLIECVSPLCGVDAKAKVAVMKFLNFLVILYKVIELYKLDFLFL